MSPVYVFKSGLPQPTDFILILFALLMYFYAFIKGGSSPFLVLPRTWLYLVLWVSVVVLSWTLIMQSYDFLRDALFWIYNFVVASSIVFLLRAKPSYKRYLEIAISFALILSAIGVILSLGFSIRPSGFFNNPNQLAFYSLCCLSILQVINHGMIKLSPLGLLAFLSGVVGIFGAASLAAMAGFSLLVLAHFVASNSIIKLFKAFLGVGMVSILVLVIESPIKVYIFQNVEARILKVDEKINDISGERNYDRIIEFPQYMVLGAGEAHLDRFKPYDYLEIHSSFGNLLFSYGILGLGLFLALLFVIGRNAILPVWIIMSAPLLYSVTHMGLRTTIFWIFLAVVWYEYYLKRKKLC
jgi:preprotein translocase subunit Sss1